MDDSCHDLCEESDDLDCPPITDIFFRYNLGMDSFTYRALAEDFDPKEYQKLAGVERHYKSCEYCRSIRDYALRYVGAEPKI